MGSIATRGKPSDAVMIKAVWPNYGLKKFKNLTIDSIGVGYNEVRRMAIAEIRAACSDDSNKARADRVASPSRG